eukprot:Em0024g464a
MNLRGPNIAKESGAMPPSQRLYHGVFDAGHRRAGCCPDPEVVACELLLGITGCAQGVPDLRHECDFTIGFSWWSIKKWSGVLRRKPMKVMMAETGHNSQPRGAPQQYVSPITKLVTFGLPEMDLNH